MSNIIEKITAKQINPNIPEFRVGDTVRVDVRIIEGKRERIQAFEGVCVAKRSGGISETFTVRKMSGGIGVDRISSRISLYRPKEYSQLIHQRLIK